MQNKQQTLAQLRRAAKLAAVQAVLDGSEPFTAQEIESAVQAARHEAQKEWTRVAPTTGSMTNQNPVRSTEYVQQL